MPAQRRKNQSRTQKTKHAQDELVIHEDDCEPEFSLEEHPHQHALFIVGDKYLFLVHQTNTWLLEHQYQLIIRVSIPPETKQKLDEIRQKNPSAWHIIGNKETDKFTLHDIKLGKKKSFMGAVWQGWPTADPCEHWPWCNERPLLDDIKVKIEDVVYFRRFDYQLSIPPDMTCILFGYGDEAHIQHYQVKPPTFDLVASLKKTPRWLPVSLLESGVLISFPDIPESPPCNTCPPAYYKENPLEVDTHNIRISKIDGKHLYKLLTIDKVVFFGNFPVNRPDESN